MRHRLWYMVGLGLGSLFAGSVRGSAQNGQQPGCDKPPADVYTVGLDAKLTAAIPALKQFAGSAQLGLSRRLEKVHDLLPGIYSFQVLEYTFCRMERRGDISAADYRSLVQGTLPVVLGVPGTTLGAILTAHRIDTDVSKGPGSAGKIGGFCSRGGYAVLIKRDSVPFDFCKDYYSLVLSGADRDDEHGGAFCDVVIVAKREKRSWPLPRLWQSKRLDTDVPGDRAHLTLAVSGAKGAPAMECSLQLDVRPIK